MTIEKETYRNEAAMKAAKARTAARHKAGQEPKHTNKLPNGQFEVHWALPNDPSHSSNQTPPPKRRMTRRQFEDEQAEQAGVELTN